MRFLAVLLAFLLIDGTALVAQVPSQGDATVPISGSVRDPAYRPVRGARVLVVETGAEAWTDEAGGFRLRIDRARVEPGLTLRVEAPGYRPAEQRVDVDGGFAEIVLERAPVSLEGIEVAALPVVTGRGVRPARGTVIDVPAVVASAQVETLAELIQARVPGVSVFGASGEPGTPVEVRIRGLDSPWSNGEVPIYVDGVRFGVERWGALDQTFWLPELAPEDIEAIEVVKGPASTLWYGPDPSRGAILVTTRRRGAGPRGFSQRIVLEHGWVGTDADFPANWARCDGSSGGACEGQPVGQVISDRPLVRDRMLDHRPVSTVHWSGRGGTERFAAYGSLGWSRNRGIFPAVGFDRWSSSLGVRIRPAAAWEVELGLGLADIDVSPPHFGYLDLFGTPGSSFLARALLGNPLTVGLAPADGWQGTDGDSVLAIERAERSRRIQPLVRVVHTPLPWLTHTLVAGAHVVRDDARQRNPGFDLPGKPYVDLTESGARLYTLDYRARLQAIQSEDRRHGLAFLLGAQANWGRDYESHRSGYEAPPEEPALISESEWEHEAIALLAESRYDYRGRFSAEVGLRSDWLKTPFSGPLPGLFSGDRDHLVSYRTGVTYLAYDGEARRAPLPGIDAVRFRAAYGAAERIPRFLGRLPSWLESLRWAPSSEPGVVQAVPVWLVGEEQLAETELGVELDLLGGRIGLAASTFRRTTRDDDLFARNPYEERRVVYRLRNQGVELVADADILRGRNVAWTARVAATHLANKTFETGDTAWLYHFWNEVREGFPAHGFYVRRILDVDTVAERVIVADEREFAGSIIPSWEAALDTEVRLWRRLRLRALMDGRWGFHILNDTQLTRDRTANNSERFVRIGELPAAERLRYLGPYVGSNGGPVLPSDVVGDYIQDGTFLRVRELAATLELPRGWAARIGASAASLTLAGRNVALWSRYDGIDPEVPALSTPTLSRIDSFAVPQATRWVGRLTLQF